MNSDFKSSFLRDIKKISNADILNAIERTIEEVEAARDLSLIKNIKKLAGYKNYYRIKIGAYRLGIVFDDNMVTFVRFLHRKDVYKFFP